MTRRAGPPPARVGVAGLGVMGGAIAGHLLAAGFATLGYDPDGRARRRAEDAGVGLFGSVGELGEESDVVVCSLPSADALAEVCRQLSGCETPPGVVIEASTLSLSDKEAARRCLEAVGTVLLDCPISGTGAQMARKEAVVYASGEAAALSLVAPVLSAFARAVHHLGPFGNGTKLKFVANLLVSVHNVAAAEALALAGAAGLPLEAAFAALTAGAGSSAMLEVRGPMMLARSYEPATMRVGLFGKDVRLITDFVGSLAAAAPTFFAASGVYEEAARRGLGALDTAAVFEVLVGDETPRRGATAGPARGGGGKRADA